MKIKQSNFGKQGLMEKVTKRRLQFFLAYTGCFLILAYSIFSVFLTEQKSFVWVPDGLQQHFNALLYYRRWLREIIQTLLVEHRFEVQLWDIHIGMGSDVLTTLHYYVIGDPLNLLSVFVSDESKMEVFYDGMILFRIYLAGLSFAAYCRFHQQRPYATLLGSLVYAFCYWVIIAVRHPYFLNPMIYLPLILIGVDKIYQKKKPWLYIGMLALATISSFYFAYMICIFIVVYVTIRYFMQYHKLVIKKDIWGWIGKFLLYSIIALMIAAVMLIPVVMMTLSTGRANITTYLPTFYPMSYYKQVFVGFLIGGASNWCELGYTGLQIITVIVLLLNWNRYKGLKLGLIVMTMLFLIPFGGHILNGGSYVINRFMWAYSMLIAYVAVKMYPALVNINRKKKIALLVFGGLYVYICYQIYLSTEKGYILIALSMLLAMMALLVFTSQEQKRTLWFQGVFLLFVMGQLVYQGRMTYEPSGKNYVAEFADKGEALNLLTTNTAGSLVAAVDPDENYRYESARDAELKNTAMQLGINGVSYYFSLANPYINEFQREMYIDQTRDFCYSGFDGRTILDQLAGVRYYVVKESGKGAKPYQYKELIGQRIIDEDAEEPDSYLAFENEETLPIGFTSSNYIPRSTYEKMSVTEKQQALLQGVVVDEDALQEIADTDEITPAEVSFTDQSVPYTVDETNGLSVEGNKIVVTEKNASMRLAFEGVKKSETYVIFSGLDYQSEDGSTDRVHLYVYCGGVKKQITFLNKENKFYSGVNHILSNAGYHKKATTGVRIRFKETGTYSFDDLEIVCQPVADIKEQKESLKQDTLENLTFTGSQFTGSLTMEQDKLLCMSVPYSNGWTAYIDGEQTEILQADTMYMALYVPSGTHEIKFVYHTPYLKAGAGVSVMGILLWIGLIIYYRKKAKTETESEVLKSE